MGKRLRQMKGQSAIEYLTTYGWMLLVIAIVGGAIFTTVQDSSNIQQTTGFTGEDVQISNFGLNSADNLELEVRAASTDQVIINNITLSGLDADQSQASVTQTISSNNVIAAGDTKSFEVTGVESSDNSNQYDVEIVYDTGTLDNIAINGTLTGNLAITP